MDLTALEGLDRTIRLINADYFNNALDDGVILRGLLATTVRVVASESNLTTLAGQTALTTLVLHLAMCGIGIELDVADVDCIGSQPPIFGDSLPHALIDHLGRTFPWVAVNETRNPDLTIALGSTVVDGAHIIACGSETRCRVSVRRTS